MDIVKLAKNYNDFQDDVGHGREVNFEKTLPSLFTENFQKIANGVTLVSHRGELKQQLIAVQDMAGKWRIEVKEIALLQDPFRCFIRYFLISEKAGTFDVMANLWINKDSLIEKIDEIYYQVTSS